MQCNKNKIKVKYVWLCKVSKYIDRLIVKLKTIEYNEDSFYYLSSYILDLGL